MNQRSELARIMDIKNAIRKIQEIAPIMNYYDRNEDLNRIFLDAINYNLVILGEAVKGLSAQTRAQYDFSDWGKIVGLRNILVHNYESIDARMIDELMQEGLMELHLALGGNLEEE